MRRRWLLWTGLGAVGALSAAGGSNRRGHSSLPVQGAASAATRFRPSRLAWYIAASARASQAP